jgi:hypothetical protein
VSPYVFQVVTEEWPNDTVFPASLGPVAYSYTSGLRLFSSDGTNQPIIGQGAKVWNETNQGPESNLHADLLDTFHANAFANSVVANSRTVFTGSGLLGGGPLSGNLTITANDASTTVNGVVRLNDTITSQNVGQAATANAVNAVQNNISTFAANISATVSLLRSGTVNSVTIAAGTGLVQSGSPITGTGTITVTANDASVSVNGVVRLNDSLTSTNVGQAATANIVRYLDVYKVSNTRQVITGLGLRGGGDLSVDRTLIANDASLTVNGIVVLNDTLNSSNNFQAATSNTVNVLARVFGGGNFPALVPPNVAAYGGGNGQYRM